MRPPSAERPAERRGARTLAHLHPRAAARARAVGCARRRSRAHGLRLGGAGAPPHVAAGADGGPSRGSRPSCAHNAEFCKYNAAILHTARRLARGRCGARRPQRRHGARVPVDVGRGPRPARAWRRRRARGSALLAGALAQLATLGLADATDVLLAGCCRRRPGGAAPRRRRCSRTPCGGRARRADDGWRRELLGRRARAVSRRRRRGPRAPARDRRVGFGPPRCARGSTGARWAGTAPLEALPADLPAFVEQSTLDRWVSYCELGADAFSGLYLRNCAAGEWAQMPRQFTRPFAHARPGRTECTTSAPSRRAARGAPARRRRRPPRDDRAAARDTAASRSRASSRARDAARRRGAAAGRRPSATSRTRTREPPVARATRRCTLLGGRCTSRAARRPGVAAAAARRPAGAAAPCAPTARPLDPGAVRAAARRRSAGERRGGCGALALHRTPPRALHPSRARAPLARAAARRAFEFCSSARGGAARGVASRRSSALLRRRARARPVRARAAAARPRVRASRRARARAPARTASSVIGRARAERARARR